MSEEIILEVAKQPIDFLFYFGCFLLAALGAYLATFLDRHYRDVSELVAVAALAALTSIYVVAGIVWVADVHPDNVRPLWFLAGAIGTLGRQAFQLVGWLIEAVGKKLGFKIHVRREENNLPYVGDDFGDDFEDDFGHRSTVNVKDDIDDIISDDGENGPV